MKSTNFFPYVDVSPLKTNTKAMAGLKLKSILTMELLANHSNRDYEPGKHIDKWNVSSGQLSRLHFLQAISSWSPKMVFELHITGLPDMTHPAQGNLMVTLFIRTRAETEQAAKELIISHYLALMPLLDTFFPELDFSPIINADELSHRHKPFHPHHALSLVRKNQSLVLGKPFEKYSLGFGPMVKKFDNTLTLVTHRFPWLHPIIDSNRLFDVIIHQMDPVQIIIRFKTVTTGRKTTEQLRRTIIVCDDFLSILNKSQNTLKIQANAIRDLSLKQLSLLDGPCFNIGVFILAPHVVETSLANVLGESITGPKSTDEIEDCFIGGYKVETTRNNNVLSDKFYQDRTPFTLPEAASALIIPDPPLDGNYGLPVRHFRTSPAVIPKIFGNSHDNVILFNNEHAGQNTPISISPHDRMRHMFVLGQTGTGKSTLLEHLCLADIRAGHGLAVIDPHGEMVDSILGKIPQNRFEDVIVFDFLDKERPLGFNLIEWHTIEERDLIIDELYLAMDRLYDMRETGGPIFESNFRGMLKLLMGDGPRADFVPILLDFPTCYLSKKFRNWLFHTVDDLQVKDFKYELERTGGQASVENLSPYITSKFSRFVGDTILRRIIGQEKNSIDFEKVMNSGKILLVKVGKGRFGATVSGLITSQLVARLKLAAMKRAEIPPENRRDFFLYVDESHNLPPENFMELLAEARKYRMGLVFATQNTSQLANPLVGNNSFLSAILGNVGTIITFRLGQEDAFKLAPILFPKFSAIDIIGLPNWHGYARIHLSGQSTPPFSFKTIKDDAPYDAEVAFKVKTMSRLRYGTNWEVVEAQIRRRRKAWQE